VTQYTQLKLQRPEERRLSKDKVGPLLKCFCIHLLPGKNSDNPQYYSFHVQGHSASVATAAEGKNKEGR